MKTVENILFGDPLEKHILLAALNHEFNIAPSDQDECLIHENGEQRKWFSRVKALLHKRGISQAVDFDSSYKQLRYDWPFNLNNIKGQILDEIEALKLDLEISGESYTGKVYPKGTPYDYFRDVKKIISEAVESIYIIDPYLNCQILDELIAAKQVDTRILCRKNFADIQAHAQKFSEQYSSSLTVKKSKDFHDRLLIIDQKICWITGCSFDQGGAKPSYLLPIDGDLAQDKITAYQQIWDSI